MAFSLYHAQALISDDDFLVIQGDIIFEPSLIRKMAQFQSRRRRIVFIAISKNLKEAHTHRIVKIDWRKRVNRIRKRAEGEKGEYRCIGAWGFSSEIFRYLASMSMSDERAWTIMTVLEQLFGKMPYHCLERFMALVSPPGRPTLTL